MSKLQDCVKVLGFVLSSVMKGLRCVCMFESFDESVPFQTRTVWNYGSAISSSAPTLQAHTSSWDFSTSGQCSLLAVKVTWNVFRSRPAEPFIYFLLLLSESPLYQEPILSTVRGTLYIRVLKPLPWGPIWTVSGLWGPNEKQKHNFLSIAVMYLSKCKQCKYLNVAWY